MSKTTLEDKLRELTATSQSVSLEARVLRCFFGHPIMVGSPSGGGSRPLDLSRPDDRRMYLDSVWDKFRQLKDSLDFGDKEQAHDFYMKYRDLL